MKILVIDTETMAMDIKDQFETQRAFDIGAAVYDTEKGIVDTFTAQVDGVRYIGTYSENLNPEYYRNRPTMSVKDIKERLTAMAESVDAVTAFNSDFDQKALRNIGILLKFDFCMMKLFWKTTCETSEYKDWATRTGNVKSDGRPRKTAQAAYRFFSKTNFVEEHTAMSDVLIEVEILKGLLK